MLLTVSVLRHSRYICTEASCCDIGEGGLTLITSEPLCAGEGVQLSLALPTCALSLRAIVRNRSGLRYGVEFLRLLPGYRESILTFCRKLRYETAQELELEN